MTVEQRLAEALRGNDQYEPSADLFAKVRRSIAEDRVHRRRTRRLTAVIGGGVALVGVYIATFLDITDGRAEMPWWSLEILADAILIVLLLTLGPLIRRFGATYVSDVFRADRSTGRHFLRLLDIAYYLVFAAYIMITASFSARPEWISLADQLEAEAQRVGGLMLLMGILHVVTIAAMTVIGLVFAANQRRAARATLGDDALPPNPTAYRIDRAITIVVWVATVLLVGWVLLNVILALIGIGGE